MQATAQDAMVWTEPFAISGDEDKMNGPDRVVRVVMSVIIVFPSPFTNAESCSYRVLILALGVFPCSGIQFGLQHRGSR